MKTKPAKPVRQAEAGAKKIAMLERKGVFRKKQKRLVSSTIQGLQMYDGRPMVLWGVDVQPVQIPLRRRAVCKIPKGKQVCSLRLSPRCAFVDAGLQDKDILVSVEGQFLDKGDLRELASVFEKLGQRKRTLNITYLRAGKLEIAQIKLGGGE